MAETDLDQIFGPDERTVPPAQAAGQEAGQTQAPAQPEPDPETVQTSMDTEDFWAAAGEPDEFQGNPFMTPDEKETALQERWVLVGMDVRTADTEVGPTWFVDVILPTGEIRTLTFKNGGGMFSRDHYLTRAQEWFKTHQGGRIQLRLGKKGRTWLVERP